MVFRPTLSDFILKMPRGAQVIYPKDLGPILMLADIYPGVPRARVAASGPARCRWRMLRAGADIVGYELREDFADRAQQNVESFLGADALDRYRRRAARLLRRHRRDRARPRRARPARAVAGRASTPSGRCAPAASSSPTRRASSRRCSCARRLDGSALRMAETLEVLHRRLARRGPGGAPGPPDGRPHRVPHPRPLLGAERARERPRPPARRRRRAGRRRWLPPRLHDPRAVLGGPGASGLVVRRPGPASGARADRPGDHLARRARRVGVVVVLAAIGQAVGLLAGSRLAPDLRARSGGGRPTGRSVPSPA